MLAYDVRGNGPRNLILLHGFLGSGRNLASLARRWVEADPRLRIILPDLTGHGTSPSLSEGADLTTLARDVLALADFLHLPRPLTVVGHSIGGRVGLALRLLEPAAVGQLVLLDISPAPMGALTGGLQQVLERLLVAPANAESREEMRTFFTADGVSGPLADWLLMNLLHEGGYYRWRIDRASLGQFHRRIVDTDLWGALDVAQFPTSGHVHCIRGGASDYVSDAEMERLQKLGVSVESLPGAGHFVHVDAQGPLLAALQKALP